MKRKNISEKRLKAQTTLNNISKYALYDCSAYELSKAEADVCCEALRFWIDSMEFDEELDVIDTTKTCDNCYHVDLCYQDSDKKMCETNENWLDMHLVDEVS